MKSAWLEEPQLYDGTQLRSHWIEKISSLQGDAILGFIGPADVPIEHMVDLEDVARNAPIYSESMLHFLIEHFDKDLEKMILRQRLLIAILQEEIQKSIQKSNIRRRGNDLYDGKAKLSVSVATSSPISCLIHTAINISSKNTPVLTKGLKDYGIEPKILAKEIMKRYTDEMNSIEHARTKVRPVA